MMFWEDLLSGEFFKAQTIIRVCADNPLIDPAFIDDLVEI